MKNTLRLLSCLLFCIACSCVEKKEFAVSDSTEEAVIREGSMERNNLLDTYPEVPDASAILKGGDSGIVVYTLLQQRYSDALMVLKKEAGALGAKLIVTILSPETGAAINASTKKGIPFIVETAKKAGIDVYDFTTPLAKYTPQQITQMPIDGHWSVDGSEIVAALYKPVLDANKAVASTKTFTEAERAKTFGDLDPNQDVALDGGKGIPYQLVTNSQGLRMKETLTFPKAKQRILFLGDSQLYSPFLDNGQMFTALLQQQYPDKELINAGVIGYTLDDCASLLAEKAKYTEPDIIIMVTNPNDIGDFYFTQRNRISRSKNAFAPVPAELSLYRKLFESTK